MVFVFFFFFSSRRRHTRWPRDWSSDVCSSDLAELQAQGRAVRELTVNRLLHDLGYSRQSNRRTSGGCYHPDRDAPFQDINRRAKAFQRQGQRVARHGSYLSRHARNATSSLSLDVLPQSVIYINSRVTDAMPGHHQQEPYHRICWALAYALRPRGTEDVAISDKTR